MCHVDRNDIMISPAGWSYRNRAVRLGQVLLLFTNEPVIQYFSLMLTSVEYLKSW